MLVAEFSITPVTGDDLTPFIDAAIEIVRKSGLKYEVEALGTTIEGELDQVMDVIKKAHQAVMDLGAGRVLTEVRIDHKASGITMDEEVERYRAYV